MATHGMLKLPPYFDTERSGPGVSRLEVKLERAKADVRPNTTTCSAILTNAPAEEFRQVRHPAYNREHYKNIMLKTLTAFL